MSGAVLISLAFCRGAKVAPGYAGGGLRAGGGYEGGKGEKKA